MIRGHANLMILLNRIIYFLKLHIFKKILLLIYLLKQYTGKAFPVSSTDIIRDNTHLTSMKIVQFSRPPIHLAQLHPKFFHLLDLGCPISNEPQPPPPLPLQIIINQLKENIIQG